MPYDGRETRPMMDIAMKMEAPPPIPKRLGSPNGLRADS